MSAVSAPTRVNGPRRIARPSSPRHDEEIVSRLRKVTGQLSGVRGMYDDGRYCIDVLDQLAAARAAVDAVALLILEDHINACVRDAIARGEIEEKIPELVSAVRRFVRSR